VLYFSGADPIPAKRNIFSLLSFENSTPFVPCKALGFTVKNTSMRSKSLQKLFEQVLEGRSDAAVKKASLSVTSTEVQEMENAYAEALGDGADAQTLAALWKEIRRCKNEASEYA
jgi:hypothetical protein